MCIRDRQKVQAVTQMKAQPKDAMANLKAEMVKTTNDELSKRDEQIKLLHEKLAERELKESSEKTKTTKEILELLKELK